VANVDFLSLQSLSGTLRSQFEQATWHLLKSLIRSFGALVCQGDGNVQWRAAMVNF
jgi:hypothetical protein